MTWEGNESKVVSTPRLFRGRAIRLELPWASGRTAVLDARGTGPTESSGQARRQSLSSTGAALGGTLASIAAGIGLVLYSFSLAEASPKTYTYTVFFFGGVALMFAPVYFGLWKARGPARTALLVLTGIISYVPEVLRAPTRVYLGDELAHFGQAIQMYDTGQLFPPNPLVPVSAHYPGFELAINTLRSLSGLSTYRSGMVLLVLCHVVAVLGVYEIAVAVMPEKIAVWSAAVFAISPQLLAFDSMFSYESLGLPLAIVGLAAASRATRERDAARRRLLLGFVGIFVLAAIVTHHVSSFALLAGLFVLAVGWLIVPHTGVDRRGGAVLLGLSLGGVVVAVLWAVTLHVGLANYLFASAQQGVEALFHRVFGGAPTSGGTAAGYGIRAPEGGSGKPRLETLVSELTPVVWFVLCGLGVWRNRRALNPTWILVLSLASAYFVLLPLIFVGTAQTVAHRSWAFSYIGLACVGVAGAASVAEGLRHWRGLPRAGAHLRRWFAAGRRPRIKTTAMLAGAIALPALLALSAYGTGVNVYVQYPGPAVLGADGRSTPKEAVALAEWFNRRVGPGHTVLSDSRTGVILYGLAREVPDSVLASEVLLQSTAVSPQLRLEVERGAGYVVLNKNLLKYPSQAGYYVWPFEPPVPEPLPAQYFNRLLNVPWLVPVYKSTDYTVLKVVS